MTRHDRRRLIIGTWVALVALITAVSVISIRDEIEGTRWTEALYTTLRMFVFERDLDKFPSSWTLICVHFLAPALTFSALGMLLTYLMRSSPYLLTLLLRRHTVVCSLGRTGKLICSSLRKMDVRTVGIEDREVEPLFDWTLDQGVIFLNRDPRSLSALQLAACKRARNIIFADDDDLVNLDDALRSVEFLDKKKAHTGILVWAHVADNRLRENMLMAINTQPPSRLRLFDAFHIAAHQMLKVHFGPARRQGIRRITISGFGDFGRDILEELVLCLDPGDSPILRIIDPKDVGAEVRHMVTHLGKNLNISFHCGDLRDFTEHKETRDEVYFLCADDDHGNLNAALSMARCATGASIFVRMQHWPMTGVVDHFGSNLGIVFVNVDELVSGGLADVSELRK